MNRQELLTYIEGKILPEIQNTANPIYLKLLLKVAELKEDETEMEDLVDEFLQSDAATTT